MRKIILFLLFLQFQLCCYAQNRMLDSLKAALRNAKADTARLRLYVALGEASSKQDMLQYTEPALQLVDHLFLVEKDKQERQKLIEQEQSLLSLMGVYYRNSSVAEWGKAMAYLQKRLQAIEKTGDQRRAGSFLYGMAGVSIERFGTLSQVHNQKHICSKGNQRHDFNGERILVYGCFLQFGRKL